MGFKSAFLEPVIAPNAAAHIYKSFLSLLSDKFEFELFDWNLSPHPN